MSKPLCPECGLPYNPGNIKGHQASLGCERDSAKLQGYVSASKHIRILRRVGIPVRTIQRPLLVVYYIPVWAFMLCEELGIQAVRLRDIKKSKRTLVRKTLESYKNNPDKIAAMLSEHLLSDEKWLRTECEAWLRVNGYLGGRYGSECKPEGTARAASQARET